MVLIKSVTKCLRLIFSSLFQLVSFKENNNAPVQDIEDHESTKKDERVSTPTKRSQSSTSISQPSTPMKRSQPCTSISEPTPSKLFCSSPSQSPRTSLSPTIPSNAVGKLNSVILNFVHVIFAFKRLGLTLHIFTQKRKLPYRSMKFFHQN